MHYEDSSLPETKQTPDWLLFCKQNDSSSLEKAVSRRCFSMSGAAFKKSVEHRKATFLQAKGCGTF